jgi:hypothetical protein
MSMGWRYVSELQPQWNDTDRQKLKYLEKNLSQCHFVHHKSNMDWLGSKPRSAQWLSAWAMATAKNILIHGAIVGGI